MKRSTALLRRLDWRVGRRSSSPRVPEGMTREEFEEAVADLPSDIDPDELREFVEGAGEEACPVFKERLKVFLWGWMGHSDTAVTVRRPGRLLN